LAFVLWIQPNTIVVNTTTSGTVDSGTTVTLVDAVLTQSDDYWNLARLTITETTDSGAPEGETAVITDFTAVDDTLHFAALTVAPESGDAYTVEFGTLIDRAEANDARITWGVNPVEAAMGSLESTGVVGTITPEDPIPPQYVSETPAEDLFTETEGVNIPIFYPIFKMTADTTGWPIQIFWITGAITLAILLGVITLMKLNSMMAAGIVSGGVVVVACSMEILEWWVLYVYAAMAVTFIIYQRVSEP
ncbi:hypothetical protein LCGC14_3096020, partial [marine sediment metagenome]